MDTENTFFIWFIIGFCSTILFIFVVKLFLFTITTIFQQLYIHNTQYPQQISMRSHLSPLQEIQLQEIIVHPNGELNIGRIIREC